MPRGDKSKYTDKQKRQVEHIKRSDKERGVPEYEAESRAWATVNAIDHGGKKSGSGRRKPKIRPHEKRGSEGWGRPSCRCPVCPNQ